MQFLLFGLFFLVSIYGCKGKASSLLLSVRSKSGGYILTTLASIPFFRRKPSSSSATSSDGSPSSSNDLNDLNNWSTRDWQQRVEELKTEVATLKAQLQVA